MNDERDFKYLPEGWKWVRLEEVCKVQCGFAFKSVEFSEEGIPIIKITNISDQRVTLNNKDSYLPMDKIQFYQNFIIKEKDILVALSGATVGKIGIIKGIKVALLNQRVGRFIINSKAINNMFLFFLLSKNEFYNFILNNSASSAQPNISPSFIESFDFTLPPLPEQQKIAEILETVDNVIEKTDRIIEKYKCIKQGLMQDLLTKGIDENGNIRSEKTHKFKDSPIGRIPKEWEVVRLGEIGEIIMGQSPASSLVNQEEIGIAFLQGNAEFGSRHPLPKNWIIKPLKLAPKDSILISVRAPVGDMNTANRVYCIGRGLSAIKIINSKANNLFIWYNLYFFRDKLVKISQGSTFEAIGYKELNNFLIPLPPLPEQQRIAEILSNIDQTIEKEQQYKEKLERLKQGLMEDLLTGKIRVNHLIKENLIEKGLQNV